jgi:hypothetical protein
VLNACRRIDIEIEAVLVKFGRFAGMGEKLAERGKLLGPELNTTEPLRSGKFLAKTAYSLYSHPLDTPDPIAHPCPLGFSDLAIEPAPCL